MCSRDKPQFWVYPRPVMMRVPQFGRIFMKNGPETSQQIFWWISYDDIVGICWECLVKGVV